MEQKPAKKAKSTSAIRTKVIPPLGDLGELPRSYNSDTIFLVAQEPHWLFTYWDIDISLHPGGRTCLKVMQEGRPEIQEIEVPFETKNWYIPVSQAGADYTVEIGYYRATTWHVLARSQSVATPQDHVSDSEKFDYAMVPLHLSFDRLIHNIENAIGQGEDLVQTLTRLQHDGSILAEAASSPGGLNSEEFAVLRTLLGEDLLAHLSSQPLSSQDWQTVVRQHLDLHAGSSGEMSSLQAPELGRILETLSSQTGMSSWTPSALSSWALSALTSWTAGASETIGRIGLPESSWNSAGLSSWLEAGSTSWSGAVLSPQSQSALTSWSEASLSSWGHAATSSWGASEQSPAFGVPARDFFLHVNSEVIFYGGTDPKAHVTIDGKVIKLNPDGSFRYHFIFPDGRSEIPIIATSPDGVETRSATLRFERQTARQGDVGYTKQPDFSIPFGSRG